MKEDRLNDLFKNYDPELSSRLNFIERLENNLNAVELIHKENARVMKRNRIAVIAASIAGFVSGFALSMLLPYIEGLLALFINKLSDSLPQAEFLSDFSPACAWLIIGTASVFIAISTYNFTLNSQALKYERRED